MNFLKKLHDATLLDAHLDWQTGELRLGLRSRLINMPKGCLIAESVSNFILPRKFSWGRSVSINNIVVKTEKDSTVLLIEMQSGDIIEITCKHFHLDPPLDFQATGGIRNLA